MVSGLPSTNDARIHEYRAPVIRVFVPYSWMALPIARLRHDGVGPPSMNLRRIHLRRRDHSLIRCPIRGWLCGSPGSGTMVSGRRPRTCGEYTSVAATIRVLVVPFVDGSADRPAPARWCRGYRPRTCGAYTSVAATIRVFVVPFVDGSADHPDRGRWCRAE